ncbi:transcriptional regulator [Salinigranum rubrum]|uniref:Transcriptional regulator n=1 Tax=Salinigranum rubrum TaxID=755307 RepID=A0A2I8VN74_9EURY|nr:transcriptional regulator [Salinigranum rubrum]AUV82539.1 transcriptional regulator [Salinigranum rubrum]
MSETTPGIEAWKEHTSAFDRVQSIASTVSQPRPASYIADEAHVAENTARKHLKRLVDLNVLLKSERKGTTLYSPDPLHTRMQTLRDLLDQYDRDELIELKAELQSRIEAWRDEYGVDSPTDLRGRAADTETAAQTRDLRSTASDWELVRYRLSIVEDAIENYTTYNQDFRASA